MIGIEEVFERLSRQDLVGSSKDALLCVGVLDHGLDQQVGRDEVAHDLHALENARGFRPALLGEPFQAALHRLEGLLDRAGKLVVQRHPPAGRGYDLGDPATHLAGADDENVSELHQASI